MDEDKLIKAFKETLIELNDKYVKDLDHKIGESKFYGRKKSHLFLGRSPSKSSYFENLLAGKISKVFKGYDFFVDFPLTFEGNKKTTLYTDIMVIAKPLEKSKCPKLCAIIELKTDLGYLKMDEGAKTKRKNREKMFKKSKAEFNLIPGDYYGNKEDGNKKIQIEIKNDLKKIFVVATLKNQHNVIDEKGNQIQKYIPYKKEMEKNGYDTIFLLDKNTYIGKRNINPEIEKAIKDNRKDIINAFKGL
ncbi:MAG: hypothetical protein ABIG84_06765 [archaeon]